MSSYWDFLALSPSNLLSMSDLPSPSLLSQGLSFYLGIGYPAKIPHVCFS